MVPTISLQRIPLNIKLLWILSAHLLPYEVKTHKKKCDTLEQQEVEMHSLSRQQTPNRCSEQQKR